MMMDIDIDRKKNEEDDANEKTKKEEKKNWIVRVLSTFCCFTFQLIFEFFPFTLDYYWGKVSSIFTFYLCMCVNCFVRPAIDTHLRCSVYTLWTVTIDSLSFLFFLGLLNDGKPFSRVFASIILLHSFFVAKDFKVCILYNKICVKCSFICRKNGRWEMALPSTIPHLSHNWFEYTWMGRWTQSTLNFNRIVEIDQTSLVQ